jgi:F-type H+-transporting ATPase subunit epsilon
MADTVEFELVSPERLLVSEQVEMVVVPGAEGDFGVLPGHAPLISTVRPGVITVYEGGKPKDAIFVAGGFAEVTPERCTVLAEGAVRIAEADRVEAVRRVEEAREAFAAAEESEKAASLARLNSAEALVAAIDRGQVA